MSENLEVIQARARTKTEINLWLLAIAFTLFTFIISFNAAILKDNSFLAAQLTLTIPLLSSSILARAKQAHIHRSKLWETYAYVTYIFAYAFLVNVVGILVTTLVGLRFGMIFWIINILSAFFYSLFEILEGESSLWSRLYKDGVFILVILLLGILPAIINL